MRKAILAVITTSALALSLVPGSAAQAEADCVRKPGPIVSASWLATNLDFDGLVIIDIRPAAEYQAGHIAGSVNIPMEVPESAWITVRDDLLLELPEPAVLAGLLGSFGIRKNSTIVLVTSFGEPPYPQANSTRVAETLYYMGARCVSVLDGGFPVWSAEGRPSTTVVPTVTPVTYNGVVDTRVFVDIDYVHGKLGQSVIVDARDAAVYRGEVIEPWADKAGHIPTAVSMPSPLIWNADGTYKSRQDLKDIAKNVVGDDKNAEIIVYCGVGGYASAWTWVLSTVLGYRNIKMYDGSAQEWVRYYDMEI